MLGEGLHIGHHVEAAHFGGEEALGCHQFEPRALIGDELGGCHSGMGAVVVEDEDILGGLTSPARISPSSITASSAPSSIAMFCGSPPVAMMTISGSIGAECRLPPRKH